MSQRQRNPPPPCQKVGEVRLPLYEPDSRNPYVRHRSLRYPKAGTANPEVSLRVVDLQVRPWSLLSPSMAKFFQTVP